MATQQVKFRGTAATNPCMEIKLPVPLEEVKIDSDYKLLGYRGSDFKEKNSYNEIYYDTEGYRKYYKTSNNNIYVDSVSEPGYWNKDTSKLMAKAFEAGLNLIAKLVKDKHAEEAAELARLESLIVVQEESHG